MDGAWQRRGGYKTMNARTKIGGVLIVDKFRIYDRFTCSAWSNSNKEMSLNKSFVMLSILVLKRARPRYPVV